MLLYFEKKIVWGSYILGYIRSPTNFELYRGNFGGGGPPPPSLYIVYILGGGVPPPPKIASIELKNLVVDGTLIWFFGLMSRILYGPYGALIWVGWGSYMGRMGIL